MTVGNILVSVIHDNLIYRLSDESGFLRKIISEQNPLIGGWSLNEVDEGYSETLVFLENDTYFLMAEAEGEGEQDGMERGTYHANWESMLWTATPQVDTNGEFGGASGLEGTSVPFLLEGDVLSLGSGEDIAVYKRITSVPGSVSIERSPTNEVLVHFQGILMQSEDLVHWIEVTDAGQSPLRIIPDQSSLFFMARGR